MTKKSINNEDLITKQDASPNDNKELRIDKKFVLSLLSFIVTILGAVPAISHFYYAARAEEYYGIPSLYLRHNLFGDFGTLVALVIAAILLCIFPFIIKTLLEGVSESKVLNTLIKLLFSISLGLVAYMYVVYCSIILSRKSQGNLRLDSINVGATIFGFIAGFVYFYILAKGFKGTSISDKVNTQKSLCFRNIEKKLPKIMVSLYLVIIVVTSVLFVFTERRVSPVEPKNIRSYEIILDEKSEYSVVVGNYEGSAVLMKGTITGNSLLIKKGHYRIEPLGKRQIEYHRFEDVDVE